MEWTVEKLLEFIEDNNIPPTAKILYQRIEDVYFEKHGWNNVVVLKPDEYNVGQDQFLNVCTPIKYSDDDNLYLTAHY